MLHFSGSLSVHGMLICLPNSATRVRSTALHRKGGPVRVAIARSCSQRPAGPVYIQQVHARAMEHPEPQVDGHAVGRCEY